LAQKVGEFLRQELIAYGIGKVCTLQLGSNRVGDSIEAELAKIRVNKRVNPVGVGSLQEVRPVDG